MNPSGIRALGPGRARGARAYSGGLFSINKALNEPDFDPLMVLLDQILSQKLDRNCSRPRVPSLVGTGALSPSPSSGSSSAESTMPAYQTAACQ
jgi:hypothetical protein